MSNAFFICGNFGYRNNQLDGQTIKTRIIKDELVMRLGQKNVKFTDTSQWIKHILSVLISTRSNFNKSNHNIIMLGQRGIKVFLPLFHYWNRSQENKKLWYVVVGGWLPEYLKANPKLLNYCYSIDGIFVESENMRIALLELGLKNIYYMPNFKNLTSVSKDFIDNKEYKNPLKTVMFSRVIEEKGISLAIEAVRKINEMEPGSIFLDVYGPIGNYYKDEFEILTKENHDCVCYKGTANYDQSTEILKEYSILLFPTFYDGEGFPGTIIDAFASGLPVIASDWKYNKEIINDNTTGFICKPKDLVSFMECLYKVVIDPEILREMGEQCLEEVKKYQCEKVIRDFLEIVL